MTKNLFFFRFTLFVVYFLINAQVVLSQDSFQRSYESFFQLELKQVYVAPDSGFFLCGMEVDSAGHFQNSVLLHTDRNGITQWAQRYDAGNGDELRTSCQTADGKILLANALVSQTGASYDIALIKTDSTGTILWSKVVGGFQSDVPKSVCSTSDSGCVIAGITYSFNNLNQNIYLIKLDKNGDKQWSRIISSFEHSSVSSVRETFDKGFILCGDLNSGVQDTLLLIKTDSAGIPQWNKKFTGSMSQDKAYEVRQCVDSGFVILAEIDDDNKIAVIKTNEGGEIEWSKSYYGEFGRIFSTNIEIGNNGNIFLAGETFDTLYYHIFITEIDITGSIIATRSYRSGMTLTSIHQLPDNSFALTSTDFGISTSLLKTDSAGHSCNLSQRVVFDSVIVLSADTGLTWSTPSDTIFILPVSVTSIPVNENILCIDTLENLQITLYDSQTTPDFPNDAATSLLSDSGGVIYYGSRAAGLVVLDEAAGTSRSYSTANSLIPSDSITDIFLDSHHRVWVCTADSGVFRFDSINGQDIILNSTNVGIPDKITCGTSSGDTLILGTELDDVVITDGVIWQPLNSGINNSITDVKVGPDANLWVATKDSGLIMYNGNSWTRFTRQNSGLTDDSVQCLEFDAQRVLLIGTLSHGLASFDIDSAVWRGFNTSNSGLPDNNVQSIAVDSANRILVGTDHGGICLLDNSQWFVVDTSLHLPGDDIASMIISHGILWTGFTAGGLVKFEMDSLTLMIHPVWENQSVNCYPNPFSNSINISFFSELTERITISICDLAGKTVYETYRMTSPGALQDFRLDNINIPDGMYLMKISGKTFRTAFRIAMAR